MNTKKIIALILALAAALIVCVSCSGNGGERGSVSYKIKNNTLGDLAIVTMKEKVDKGQVWNFTNLVPEQEIDFTISTNLNNGAPNLDFKVTTKSGVEYSMVLNQKGDKVITINPDADEPLTKLNVTVEDK